MHNLLGGGTSFFTSAGWQPYLVSKLQSSPQTNSSLMVPKLNELWAIRITLAKIFWGEFESLSFEPKDHIECSNSAHTISSSNAHEIRLQVRQSSSKSQTSIDNLHLHMKPWHALNLHSTSRFFLWRSCCNFPGHSTNTAIPQGRRYSGDDTSYERVNEHDCGTCLSSKTCRDSSTHRLLWTQAWPQSSVANLQPFPSTYQNGHHLRVSH